MQETIAARAAAKVAAAKAAKKAQDKRVNKAERAVDNATEKLEELGGARGKSPAKAAAQAAAKKAVLVAQAAMPAGKLPSGPQVHGMRRLDEDGSLTRRLAQQEHTGDPTKEGGEPLQGRRCYMRYGRPDQEGR